MSTLKHHGLSETINKKGIVSDGIIFERFVWQLTDVMMFPVSSKTFVIKDHNLKDEGISFRFFTLCKNKEITMWGMEDEEEILEYFELIEYFENLEEPENAIGIPI